MLDYLNKFTIINTTYISRKHKINTFERLINYSYLLGVFVIHGYSKFLDGVAVGNRWLGITNYYVDAALWSDHTLGVDHCELLRSCA